MKKVFLLAISSFMVWSCNSNNETTQAAHHHDESSVNIELNNGVKWAVNEEMKPFVIKGEEIVNEYIKSGQTDNNELAGQLKDQNDNLIKSCTMTGKSHDELHKWLHPHLELVKQLENSTVENDTKEIVLKIQNSYKIFHQYFE